MTQNKPPDDRTEGRRRADPLRATARPGASQGSSIVASVAEIVAAYPEATEALLSDAVKRRPDEALRIVVACIKANPAGAAEVLRIVRESPFLKAKITMDNLMGVLLPDLVDIERAEQAVTAATAVEAAKRSESPAAPVAAKAEAQEEPNGNDDFTEPVVAALRRAREAALMNQQLQETVQDHETTDPEQGPALIPPLLHATRGSGTWEVPGDGDPADDRPEEAAATVEPLDVGPPPSDVAADEDDVIAEASLADEIGDAEIEGHDEDDDEEPVVETAASQVLHLYPDLNEVEDPVVDDPVPVPTEPRLADDIELAPEPDSVTELESEPVTEPATEINAPLPVAEPESDDLVFADYLSGGVDDDRPLLFGLSGEPLPGPSEGRPLKMMSASQADAPDDPAETQGEAAMAPGPMAGPVPVPPRDVTVIAAGEPRRSLDAGQMNQAVLRLEGFPQDASLWGLVGEDGSFEIVLRLIDGEDRVVARIDDMVCHPEALGEVEIADRKLNLQDLIIGVDLFRPGGPEDPVEAPAEGPVETPAEGPPSEEVVADIRAFERAASDYRGRGDLDA